MTQPNPSPAEKPAEDTNRPRYRAGQVVSFRVVVDELVTEGHALVLRLLGDVAHLAVLGHGGGYVQAHVDNIAPAKVDDVTNPLPAPEPAESGSGS